MTLKELQKRVYSQTDNNFDQLDEFIPTLNIVISDLNLRMSAKFTTINENLDDYTKNVTDDTVTEFNKDLYLTGIPSIMDIIITTGLSWKLQIKEDEANWTAYEATYNNYAEKYKHLVPEPYRLDIYTDIYYRKRQDKWTIW